MEAALFRETLIGDVGLIGALLLVGVVLRAKVRFFQWLLLPAPVLAGLLGFLLSPQVAGRLGLRLGAWEFTGLPFSPYVGSYTTILIAVVFGCMALSQSFSFRSMSGPLAGFAGYGVLMSAGQVVVGMLFVLLVLGPTMGSSEAIGMVLFASWSGGFGTSAALGDVFAGAGQPEITSIAFTSATVGMLTGIVGGVVLAKIGSVRGHTRAFDTEHALTPSMRTGVLEHDDRPVAARHTMSGSSLETLTLHVALIGAVVALGWLFMTTTGEVLDDFALPLFASAFLAGLVVRWLVVRTGAVRVLDGKTLKSLSGMASDLLIVCGIVSIEPAFVADHLGALALLFVLGLAFCLFLGLVIAPRFLGEGWFEKQIFTWGWATGSVATGIALLRIVDPELESGTVEDFGYAYMPLIPVEGAAVAVAPLLIVAGGSWWVVAIWGAVAVVGSVVMARQGGPAPRGSSVEP